MLISSIVAADAFQPKVDAVGGSLTYTALVSLLPLLTVFITLGVLKWKAHWAGIAAVVVALAVAIFAFKMPAGMAFLSATEGAAFGLFPIAFIVLGAVWFYELTVVSGHFEKLRDTFNLISDDPRIQAILIAFCFGGLLEALAGFGAPVAITGVMLMAVGYPPLRAAVTVLLANTAPVAFGAIAIPIITAGKLTDIDYHHIGAYVGHQTPLMAWIVPFLLIMIVDGLKGLKQIWPAALVIGVTFAISQWVSATWVSVELTDVIASLIGIAACVILLQFWKPKGTAEARERLAAVKKKEEEDGFVSTTAIEHKDSEKVNGKEIFMALLPYIIVVIIFASTKLIKPLAKFLASTDLKFAWPGLGHMENGKLVSDLLTVAGTPNGSVIYSFTWLSGPGTLLIISGIIVGIVYMINPVVMIKTLGQQLYKMRWPFLTIASVLALAYVMNLSGQTIAIGQWIAGVGTIFAFFSPVLGWIGTAVTGSDTSANALFATLQKETATVLGIDPTLVVAGNTSGGVVGKMISPQNLAIAATATGLIGKESEIFRRAIPWSIALLIMGCLLIGLQSTPLLSWMLPTF